jgi:hypothetical protein
MDLETALKRIAELEKKQAVLDQCQINQYELIKNLKSRLDTIEHVDDGGTKTARAS